MPIVSKPSHAKLYVEPPAMKQRLAEIKHLIEVLRLMKISAPIKKRMLVHCIWEVAKATGDFSGRFRSEQVICTAGSRIQRDHVYLKSALIAELLGDSPNLDEIIARAQCCTVTKEEHDKLHGIDKRLDGWDRYRAAGIIVFDMLKGERMT